MSLGVSPGSNQPSGTAADDGAFAEDHASAETMFLNAREIEDPLQRRVYLDRACGNDEGLRSKVDELLKDSTGATDYFSTAEHPERDFYDAQGTTISRYALIEKIGEGGMGTVYLAEQREPVLRKVALKIIKPGMDTRQVISRFEAERQALALMDHPNIARVLDAGSTESGRPYFVMELVQGESITAYADKMNLSTEQRLQLFLEVCSAVQHAHQKGIIHRDIKPSNVLVQRLGEFSVPKVIDFGVAKAIQGRLSTHTVLTMADQFIGTPAYMSPEQALITSEDIDTRSDIYSLGVLLYELLVGAPPFDNQELLASGVDEMRRIIREVEPQRPSLANMANARLHSVSSSPASHRVRRHRASVIPSDLDWITMKCLEKERARRYETANGLAADIRRHLENEPVVARPPSRTYRFQKAWRRNRPAFSAAAIAFAALIAASSFSARQSARRHSALVEVKRTLYIAQMQSAQQAWQKGDIHQARALLLAQLPGKGEEDLRGFEWRYFGTISRDASSVSITSDLPAGGKSVAISPDGALLAWGDFRGGIELRRTSDWRLLDSFTAHRGGVLWLEFSRDGKLLVSGGADRAVNLWNVETRAAQRRFFLTNALMTTVTCARLSPDNRLLAMGGYPAQAVHLLDVQTGDQLASFPGPLGDARHAAFSPDGRCLALNHGDNSARVIDLGRLSETRVLHGHQSIVGVIEYSPDGRLLATSEATGLIKLWSTADGRELATLSGHRNVVMALAFSPDGLTLASACRDGLIQVWDLESRAELAVLRGHSGWVNRLAFFPDGNRLVSTGEDQTCKIWKVPARQPRPLFQRESSQYADSIFSPDGNFLATVGVDEPGLRLWRGDSGELIAAFPGPVRDPFNSQGSAREQDLNALSEPHYAAFSPDSRLFAATGRDHAVHVWNASDGRAVMICPTDSAAASVLFLGSNELITGFFDDNRVRRWNIETRAELPPWTGYDGGVGQFLLSPDNKTLALWCFDGNIRLRDLQTQQNLPSIPHDSDSPIIDFSPDGTVLAVGSSRQAVTQLWNPLTGKLIYVFDGRSPVCRPVFSADDRYFAISRGWNPTVEIWDPHSLRLVGSILCEGSAAVPTSLAFSPDGRTLAVSDFGGTLRLCSLRLMKEVVSFPSLGTTGVIRFSPNGRSLAGPGMFRKNVLLTADPIETVAAELKKGSSAGTVTTNYPAGAGTASL